MYTTEDAKTFINKNDWQPLEKMILLSIFARVWELENSDNQLTLEAAEYQVNALVELFPGLSQKGQQTLLNHRMTYGILMTQR
jgi:hypothetical protein